MFVLDTNVVSALRRAGNGRADARVVAWANAIPAALLFVSVVTVLELEQGVLLAERRDAAQGEVPRRWLETQALPAFEGRVLPVDVAVARRRAGLHVPDRRGERDALIAATALVQGMVVATRNVADFAPTGVRLVDPWAT